MRSQPAGSRNTTRRDADLPPRVRSSRAGRRLDRQGWTNGLDRAPHRHPVAALPIEPGAAATTPVLPMTVVDRRRNGRLDVRRLGTQERSVADSAAGEGRHLGAEIKATDQLLELVAGGTGADVAAVLHLLAHQELPARVSRMRCSAAARRASGRSKGSLGVLASTSPQRGQRARAPGGVEGRRCRRSQPGQAITSLRAPRAGVDAKGIGFPGSGPIRRVACRS